MYDTMLLKIKNVIKRERARLFFAILTLFEKTTGNIVTLRTRPLYSKDITQVADELIKPPQCAIVLGGGIMKKYDFTLETVRMYKKVYPGLTIIVSTWDDEDPTYLDLIRNAGAEVVQSTKPEYFGTWNINLQIIATRKGLSRAKELGIPHTIKSRTDQRMYERTILETLHNLISYFPPAEWSGLNKRLVVCHRAYKYYDGYFPDMFMFGNTDDLLEYWNTPLLKKEAQYTKDFLSELYLTYAFRRRKGWPTIDSVQTIWETYRDCVIVIDWNDLDILWPKYEYFWEQPYIRKERYKKMTLKHAFIDLSFNEWFNIFSNMENKVISPIHKKKFTHFLEAVNFSDYERNYEQEGGPKSNTL